MVHVKRLELSNFKSFGGTTQIPLLPGFTVVSGPNGSGKSNILDALLFALGLASSRGMRAERLPDLVNHNQTSRGRSTVEASVTVTFDLEQDTPLQNGHSGDTETQTSQEWSVTRRLRVTHQGTYTSTYYINGVPCNLTELHEQLNQVRIYPEGYNVVLQGDVTSIISMNPRERREIIDELAGVATFDRKITQAKETLNEVKEREDRSRIVEQELIAQRDRLSQDRIKAEKYQKLRAELQQKTQWEGVLVWRKLQQQQEQLVAVIQAGDRTQTELTTQLSNLATQIQHSTTELDQLNRRVRALGEEEQLALQSTLANLQAELRQLQRQERELNGSANTSKLNIEQTALEIQQHQQTLEQLAQAQQTLKQQLIFLRQQREQAKHDLDNARASASAIAAASEAWVQQQTALNRQIETLLQTLEPQRTEKALLGERKSQSAKQIEEQNQLIQTIEPEIAAKKTQRAEIETQLLAYSAQMESLAQSLAAAEQELSIQQETQKRLLQEQRDKQRQLDKLEAQAQAIQETQGTHATKVILQSGLGGICGLIVQLGRVEPRYQLALETAAGGRLGQIVVEDDAVAASGIELLKQKRAGRATFLPLNKIAPPRFSPIVALRYANGFVDYAINLIECDRRYRDVFAYVFGNTAVFETLSAARPFLGQNRIVTLEGELLETSGAMTGGSNIHSGLRFGSSDATESNEVSGLRNRLQDLERVLERCSETINLLSNQTKHLASAVMEARQQRRESQLNYEQLQKEVKSLSLQVDGARMQISQTTQQLATFQSRLQILEQELPPREIQLQQLRQALVDLEQSHQNREWQEMQATIALIDQQVQEREVDLGSSEQKLKDLENQQERLQEKIQQLFGRQQEYHALNTAQQNQLLTLGSEINSLNEQIQQTQIDLSQLDEQLLAEKQLRDRAEQQLRDRCLNQQQLEWQLQKLQETQVTRQEELAALQSQLQSVQLELPDPLVEIPSGLNLEQLQREMRSLTGKIQAMEPVNMLALEEYNHTQSRLEQLTQKLVTLEAERTELLLRIENFTTRRQSAFIEAFNTVNQNFQTIFATLSEGDGCLQLDDAEDPNNRGLNLIAHPKGKPVQRLASMSGGEKSLTALSFIFALQRYRPSPFYAFDEVDMFLDGANVERLARMIKQQAQQAQFIVVSLRRPMIESAERTIGVTQARGAYTQVLGLKL